MARRVWSDVESNELLLYMRRLEPAMLDSLSRPADAAVDAAFDALIDGLLGSLVRLPHRATSPSGVAAKTWPSDMQSTEAT